MPFDHTTDADGHETTTLVSLKLSTDQQDRLYTQCREHYEDGIAARGDWPTRHDEHLRRYLADPTLRPRGPWLHAPRLFTGDTRSTMETIMEQLWRAVFPGFEALQFDPLDPTAVANKDVVAQAARYALRYLINDVEQGGWAHIGKMALFDALCDSTGFLKVYAWRPPFRNAHPDTIIRIENVDEGTLFFPADATGTQYPDATYVGQEIPVTWDDLLRKRRQGLTVPDRDTLKKGGRVLTERERTEQEREGRIPDESDDKDYWIVEQYERFALDEDDEEEDLVVTWYPALDKEHFPARAVYVTDLYPNQPWPTRPFFTVTVWPLPRQLSSIALPDRLRTYQDLTNRLAEQMVNYGDISILPFAFANFLTTGDLPNFQHLMPGDVIPVNDIGGLQFMPRGSMNRHFIEMLQYWSAQREGDAHVNDFSQGRSPSRPNAPRTASGTKMLLQSQREAFAGLVPHLGYQYSAAIGFWWRLWQYYAPPDLQVPLRQQATPAPASPSQSQNPFFDAYNPFGQMTGQNGVPTHG